MTYITLLFYQQVTLLNKAPYLVYQLIVIFVVDK